MDGQTVSTDARAHPKRFFKALENLLWLWSGSEREVKWSRCQKRAEKRRGLQGDTYGKPAEMSGET